MNDEPEFELIWHAPLKPERSEWYPTRESANRRIVDIRLIFREYTLLQLGEAIDWGYSER